VRSKWIGSVHTLHVERAINTNLSSHKQTEHRMDVCGRNVKRISKNNENKQLTVIQVLSAGPATVPKGAIQPDGFLGVRVAGVA
jgi:hypothetical protein